MKIDRAQEDGARQDPDLLTARTDLTFGVLGPLEVRSSTGLVHVGGPQIRALLALLLIRPGQVMSLSTLVASLWSGDAPPSAERTARTYVSRLRLALAPVTGRADPGPLIVTAPPGYLLRTDPLSVDASVFEQLTVAGRRALTRDDPVAARSHLRNALRLWRGDAFAEFPDVPLLRAEAGRLEELRLSAVENRLQSELRIGLGPDLVAELDGLVATYPLRERLWVQFMTALYRSGRQAEALSAYQRARTLLADELGLEPSIELVETHRRILAQDPQLLPGGGPAGAAGTGERTARSGRRGAETGEAPSVPAGAGGPAGRAGSTTRAPATRPEPEPLALTPPAVTPPAASSPAMSAAGTPPGASSPAMTRPAPGQPDRPARLWPAVPLLARVLAQPCVRAVGRELGRGLAAIGRGIRSAASAIGTRVRAWWGWLSGNSLADMK